MATLMIHEQHKKSKINAEIYGNFSEHLGRCIYEGLYVGEDSDIPNINGMRTDVVEALKEMKLPVLRWPGGCFADEYHWMDGIGPKEGRKKMVNTHWGGVTEDNSFGTHEFFELCRQIGCKTYVNGNVGSGTVQEMSEWVEYMTFDGLSPMAELREANGHKAPFKVDYFGVGNENWGCGGNMTPEFYGNNYRRYQTYVRNYHSDAPITKICCGPNAGDYEWTEKVLETCYAKVAPEAHGMMDGLSLHYYTVPETWSHKGSATKFNLDDYYTTLAKANFMETLIKRHGAIMDQFDPDKKIGLMVDEWGTWYDVEEGTNPGFLYQQNTMRDAMVAGLTLNIFNRYSDRVKMANIAQLVNVLQAVILTEGKKMIKTPTYYVFKMFAGHQDGTLLDSVLLDTHRVGTLEDNKLENISASVSEKDGKITVTLVNLSADETEDMHISLEETVPAKVTASILTGDMKAHNTFDEANKVKEEAFEAFNVEGKNISLKMPACSVITLSF